MNLARKSIRILETLGLPIFVPVVRLAAGESPRDQIKQLAVLIGVPILAFGGFLLFWGGVSQTIVTKYGTLPSPRQVWHEAGNLLSAHAATVAARDRFAQQRDLEVSALAGHAVKLRGEAQNATGAQKASLISKASLLEARAAQARAKRYSGSPTYIDQIMTSLKTVFTGFVIASLVAIPLGILCGLSTLFQAAMTPLIQIFKPVSPLAWLPIVMIVVGAVYTTEPKEAWFEKSFISSAFTVALCSLWPTLANTAVGVASIDKDHLNVARVLKLTWWTRVRKIVLPSSLPLMFAGLRISLGVGWMVLIAAEMLAQNPGLGKFVWDMFQNGSSQTLAQIMVAVFTIGTIGFLLDRVMVALQRAVSYDVAA
jgi:nitrate/nitrite transport system permease protein